MRISVKRKIDAPSEALWNYLADYSNISRFHPMLNGSHFTGGNTTCEVGTTRQCDMKDGNYLQEKITQWEDGSHYSVQITETSMPVKNASATLGVRSTGEGESEAYMDLNLEAKNPLMSPMIFLMFKYKAAPSILKGLEDLYKQEHKLAMA